MNTRIAMSTVSLVLLALSAGFVPAGPVLAEKPSRIEARQEGEDLRKAPQEQRGTVHPPAANGAAVRGGQHPASAHQGGQGQPTAVHPGSQGAAGSRGGPPAGSPPQGPRPQAGRDDRSADRSRPGGQGHPDRERRDQDIHRYARPPTNYQPNWDRDRGSHDRHDAVRYRHDTPRYRYADARHGYNPPRVHHHYPARRYYYPPRGYIAPVLPRSVVVVNFNSGRYWYGGGVWYRPHGTRYVVVAPPLGVFVSVLPAYYSTYWYGGLPYYYANDAYYLWRETRSAYEVVAAPPGAPAVAADPVTEDIYVYPSQGQSEEQTAFDRYECHRWAADETGFDPTQPWGGVSEDQAAALRDAYLRAMTACLEGRGYTVR